jgi:hypothetical protein
MVDLHQTRNPDLPNVGIDAVGWLFLALAAVIVAVAGVIAYEAYDSTVASVSHMVAR